MSGLIGLAGVALGGLLVLFADAVRRRVEGRRAQVQSLADAAIAFAVAYYRLAGERRDAYLAGDRPVDVRASRYEAETRLFMTPGAERMRPTATAVGQAYQRVVKSFDTEDHEVSFAEFRQALRLFEEEVRAVRRLRSV